MQHYKYGDDTLAVEGKDGDGHKVGLKSLHVLLDQDSGGWTAQAVELDIFASGATKEQAQRNFEVSLSNTIKLHVSKYGSIQKMLVPAPKEVWDEYYAAPTCFEFSTIVEVEAEKKFPGLNFGAIEYVEPTKQAA